MIVKLIKGGAVLVASQGVIFVLQTLLLQRGDHQGVADLAAYVGTISLCFYLLDGNSGIAFLQGLRFIDEGELRSGFFLYRALVVAIGLVLAIGVVLTERADIGILAAATFVGSIMRCYGLDGDLDRRGLQYLATAFANAWIIFIGAIGLTFGRVDASIIAVGVILGSIVSLVGRLLTRTRNGVPRASKHSSKALLHILSFLGTYGIGQIYGRMSLGLLGGLFTGATAAFAIYAKQTMNAVGILNALVRRVELSHNAQTERGPKLGDFKWSLGLQAIAAIIISFGLLFAGHFAKVATSAAVAIIAWQILEKVSSNQAFLLQIMGRARQAYAMLIMVCAVGLAAIYTGGLVFRNVLFYTTIESIAFLICAFSWILSYKRMARRDMAAK